MIELKKIYQKTSKQTQNRLQEIFDSFQIDFNNLYNIADNKTKKRVNTYIEEWQDKGLLKGYFGSLAKSIYNRTRVKNSEILELLIYGAYIEEQNKLEEQELNIFKEDVNYYYQQGQEEVNKTLPKNKQKHSVIPDAIFLALLTMPNSKGYIRQDYNEALAKYNADQIYRQATIDLQQQKELDITNDIYQNIIKKQNNSKININGDKISGDIDLTLIGINNKAKLEGIKSIDNDAKVVFLAEMDNKTTPMCHSLNRQEFYIDKENEFDRYYGEIPNELSIQRIKCKGLVLGLNLPPISHHFHWCRSTIQYIPPTIQDENVVFDSMGNIIFNGIKVLGIAELKEINRVALLENLNRMDKVFKDFPILKNRKIKYKVINLNNGSAMRVGPTSKNGYILEINKNIFNKDLKEFYNLGTKKHDNPKGTTYKDIAIHEAGHMVNFEIIKKINKGNLKAIQFDYNNFITTDNIVEKAFNNLKVYDKIQKERLITDISNYALTNSEETIAEAFSDYYCNKGKANILSKEIMKIVKGMM